MRRLASFAFWGSIGALVYAQAGYPLLLAAIARVRGRRRADGGVAVRPGPETTTEPVVSLIVAAHREADVIAGKVANALALDWPRDRLEVIVACDGSPDDTPARARAAGADRVLDLPWGGKVRAQDAAVAEAHGDLLAFSDANALWEPDALRALADRFADPGVGYVCGQVRFVSDGGTNQEGLYWRYEMAIRGLESDLASVTAGNGAIYAVRPEAYVNVDPVMGHDLTLPFTLVKRGWRAVYEPGARASEKMVPTIEGELARKRRMMSHMWPIVLRGGMLSAAAQHPADSHHCQDQSGDGQGGGENQPGPDRAAEEQRIIEGPAQHRATTDNGGVAQPEERQGGLGKDGEAHGKDEFRGQNIQRRR